MSGSYFLMIILVGILAGVLSSLVGIGGGIVLVPALVIGFGFSQQMAQGTTLAMLSIPVSFVAAYSYSKNGFVDWKMAALLGIGFMIGGYVGSKFAMNLNTQTLKKMFAILMLVMALKMLFFDKK